MHKKCCLKRICELHSTRQEPFWRKFRCWQWKRWWNDGSRPLGKYQPWGNDFWHTGVWRKGRPIRFWHKFMKVMDADNAQKLGEEMSTGADYALKSCKDTYITVAAWSMPTNSIWRALRYSVAVSADCGGRFSSHLQQSSTDLEGEKFWDPKGWGIIRTFCQARGNTFITAAFGSAAYEIVQM